MRLADLPAPYAARVAGAQNGARWETYCRDARGAPWVAWNVVHDAWYDVPLLDTVRAQIDSIDGRTPGLEGPELLVECAHALRYVRRMTLDERKLLPSRAVTHVAARYFGRKFLLAPESVWAEGSAPGELSPTLVRGDRLRVMPKGKPNCWLTFDCASGSLGTVADEVARTLGLPWAPVGGTVVRVEVPLDPIRAANALLAIPLVFDAIAPVNYDWRARPESEHRPDEPWGHARDMRDDGPGLPEIVAEITAVTKMDAEILGPLRDDWGLRPYLGGGGPR